MINLKYEEMNSVLSMYFPVLKQLVDFEMNESENYIPGPHVLYGIVFNPYVKELIKGGNDLQAIKKVFDFFEELANSNDEEVKNLLQVTILEALWDEKDLYEKACKHMLISTKQINKRIGDYFRIP